MTTKSTKPENASQPPHPKAFISYAWTSPEFKERVREWAERLLEDGVDVLLDEYALKDGHDLNHYMEKMVADPGVTHVIIFSNSDYADKADTRSGGVGTESQIISSETYKRTEQNKFIPIVCEFKDSGEAALPIFLKSRKWINFSNEEHVSNNWEQLIRTLWNRPAFEKPEVGQPPAYITSPESYSPNKALSAFRKLEHAILNEKKTVHLIRDEFLQACISQADELRVRNAPDTARLSHLIVEDFKKLSEINKLIAKWVALESRVASNGIIQKSITTLLEKLLALKGPTESIGGYSDSWFDAYSLFLYECFLYIVAALIKTADFESLKGVLQYHYLPPARWGNGEKLVRFDAFYAHTSSIGTALSDGDATKRFRNESAELLKRSATIQSISFHEICQADALLFLTATLAGIHWYPQTNYYWGFSGRFELFLRASQKSEFKVLAQILAVTSGDDLRKRLLSKGDSALGQGTSYMSNRTFNIMDMDTL